MSTRSAVDASFQGRPGSQAAAIRPVYTERERERERLVKEELRVRDPEYRTSSDRCQVVLEN